MARITALGTVACVQPPHPPPPQLAMWTDSVMAWQFFVVFNRLKSHNFVHVQITTGFIFITLSAVYKASC